MGDIIPEHCMNDPQFRQILEAALNSEIKTAEKTLTGKLICLSIIAKVIFL